MKSPIARIILILIVLIGFIAVFLWKPDRILLRIILAIILPVLTIILQVGMYLAIEGFRDENDAEDYVFFLERSSHTVEVKSITILHQTLIKSGKNFTLSVSKKPPILSEINIGIDMLANAIALIVTSALISYFNPESSNLSIIFLVTSLLMAFYLMLGILLILMMQYNKKLSNKTVQIKIVFISNMIGLTTLIASFFILGEIII
jgi:hypothetical protein